MSKILATARNDRKAVWDWRYEEEGSGEGGGARSGRQVVGQLDESQSAVETLPLLLEASLGGTSGLAALLFLHGHRLLLLVRLEELHWVLLLLVLFSRLALRFGLGGGRRALLAGLPVPERTRNSHEQQHGAAEVGVLNKNNKTGHLKLSEYAKEVFVFTNFASHSATALLSTDCALPWPSFGSSLLSREKGWLGQ